MDEMLQKALFHLEKGNFSALEEMLGGPEGFDRQIVSGLTKEGSVIIPNCLRKLSLAHACLEDM